MNIPSIPWPLVIIVLLAAAGAFWYFKIRPKQQASAAATSTPTAIVDAVRAHIDNAVNAVTGHVSNVTNAQTRVLAGTVAGAAERAATTAVAAVAPAQAASPAAATPSASTSAAPATSTGAAPAAETAGASSAQPSAAPSAPEGPVMTAIYTKNLYSNTPDWRRWTDLTPEGLPIYYQIAPGSGPDEGKSVVVNPTVFSVWIAAESAYVPYSEVQSGAHAAAIAQNAAVLAQADHNKPLDGMGAYPVAQLTAEDKKFLTVMAYNLNDTMLYFKVLAGSNRAISQAMWEGESSYAGWDVNSYPADGPMVALVKPFLKA